MLGSGTLDAGTMSLNGQEVSQPFTCAHGLPSFQQSQEERERGHDEIGLLNERTSRVLQRSLDARTEKVMLLVSTPEWLSRISNISRIQNGDIGPFYRRGIGVGVKWGHGKRRNRSQKATQ